MKHLALLLLLGSVSYAQDRHGADQKQGRYAHTPVVGGTRSDGRTLQALTLSPQNGFTRLTLSLNGPCSYRVEKHSRGLQIQITGVRKFAAAFPAPRSPVTGFEKLPFEDDSGFRFLVKTKAADFEVFSSVKPARIYVDMKTP